MNSIGPVESHAEQESRLEEPVSRIYPVPHELEKTLNKYELVVAAAKRARQLAKQAQPFVASSSTNHLTVALEEIAQGFVVPVQTGPPEVLEVPRTSLATPGVSATLGVVAISEPQELEEAGTEPDDVLGSTVDDDERVVDMNEELIGTLLGTNAEGAPDEEMGLTGFESPDDTAEADILGDNGDLL